MPTKASQEHQVVEPNFTSMLDLVLLLVCFFVITVNFVQTELINESIQLPPAQAAMPMDRSAENWVFLNMDRDGRLLGSNKERDLSSPEKLRVFLQFQKQHLEESHKQQKKSGDLDVVVILRADKECRFRDVWNALKTCSAAGFRKWQLRVMVKQA